MTKNLPAIPVKAAVMLPSGVCVWHFRHGSKPDNIMGVRVAGKAYGAFSEAQAEEYKAVLARRPKRVLEPVKA